MVTCEHCGTVQAGTPRCLTCGAPVTDVVIRVDGFVPFALDEAAVRERLGDGWVLPRKPELQRCWLRTERWDVRLDAAWEAMVQTSTGWVPRAGWVDRWFDEVVAPVEGFAGFAGTGKKGLGNPESLPILAPASAEAPWKDAVGRAIQQATHSHGVSEVWVDAEPLEVERRVVLVPLWRVSEGDRVLWISGETGVIRGERRGNRRRAIGWSVGLGSQGLAALGMAAVVALPGIFLWPLLLITALGSLAGFGLLAAAGLPFAWVRDANRSAG